MAEGYDFIVIGAGSAGCALANRLTEDPAHRVLLLEAGGRDTNPWLHIPVGYYRTIFNKRLNWGYQTEPEPELEGRRIAWPRGRVLGGSSAINGLVYIRGQREDFQLWRQMGNAGWGWDDVLPYFKKAEDQERGANALHGEGGPLGVSDLKQTHEIVEAYVHACDQLGIPRTADFNGEEQEGVGYFQLTTRNGLRCSSAVAYLHPIRYRPNLDVATNALVSRIVVENRRATGVMYWRDGQLMRADVAGEVILSAGAIGSPQILQLSGIGPGDHLGELDIKVVHDLRGLGANLQDHFQARSLYRCTRPITLNDRVQSPWQKMLMGLEWLIRRTGPLTIGAGQGGIFAKTRPELATPDVQFHLILFSADKPGEPLHRFSGFTASVCQLRPESRGTVLIASRDPQDHPKIRANYLATDTDRRCMVDGLKLARRLAGTEALKPLIAEEIEPGPEVASDDDFLSYARRRGGTIFHPTSTCMMGPSGHAMAVVDSRLRVHGLRGLRVADASIMPTVISGNTNAACIMIGEKAADMIVQDRRAQAAAALQKKVRKR
ncbi:MAG: choline dehydrogenase [Rhizobiales bacterium]|nr:choline dehydrogenase [Hyphomicrobiales bacterium]